MPFSVSATSQSQIVNSGAQDIVGLARNIAGLSIADLGPGQSQMAIRGISSGQVIRDQPGVKEQVGVYLDESPISIALFTPDLELFDLERFEVLRGPQGTLFGAGSEAGTVRYITRQPQLGKFEAFTDGSVEEVSHGDVGGSARGALNIPLGDIAAARLVVYYHHLPGFIDALQPGGGVEKDVNDGDRSGVRLSVLIRPTDALSITPRIVYQNLTTNGYPRQDVYNILANPYTTVAPVTIGSLEQYTQQREELLDQFALADLKIEYGFGPATLTSITSYTDRKVRVLRDATQLTGSVTFDILGNADPNIQHDVRVNSPLYDRTALNALSEEIRIASSNSTTVQWLVGGFFQHIGRHYGQDLPTPGYDAIIGVPSSAVNAPPDTPFYSDLRYTLKQYAVFGEATWNITQQWAITGGLRYYKFDEDKDLLFAGLFADVTRAGNQPPVPAWSPLHQLQRHLAARHLSFGDRGCSSLQARAASGSRQQRSHQPAVVFGDRQSSVRQPAELAGREDLELRDRRQDPMAGPPPHAQRRRLLRGHQEPAGDHDRRHLLLTRGVQRADGPQRWRGTRAVCTAQQQLGLRRVGQLHRCEAHLVGHLDAAGRHDGGGRGPGRRQPPADGPQDAGGRERGLHAAGHGRQGLLRQPDRAVRRFIVLTIRDGAAGLGSDRWHRGSERGAPDSLRRSLLGVTDQLQRRVALLHARQSPPGAQGRPLAGGGLRE
jgi:hypothetical protein